MYCNISTSGPSIESLNTLLPQVKSRFQFSATGSFQSWAKTMIPFGSWTSDVLYLTVYDEKDILVGVLPLGVQVKFKQRFLSLGGDFYPLRAIPVDHDRRDEVCETLADTLTKMSDGIGLRFGPVESSDEVTVYLFKALKQRGWHILTNELGVLFIVEKLPTSFEDFRAGLGKKLRKNTPYYERKLFREHQTEIVHYNNETANVWAQVITDLGSIERNSWLVNKGANRESKFVNQAYLDYWNDWLVNPQASINTHIWVIYCNKKPISFACSLDSGDSRYLIANAYDSEFSDYRTGSILYWHLFKNAIEIGISRINAGIGDSGYKGLWMGKPIESVVDWVAFRPGISGMVFNKLSQILLRYTR
jgi:hypothetical protein